MKKGKSRNKRKKTRSRLLWIAIAVIGIAAVISAVCVAGMLATKENAWKTPEELLVEYMDHIPKQEYEEMYAMLHIEASGNVSQEDFVTRNSAIYEGIEVQNIAVQIIAYDEEQMTVTYQTAFDTVAGTISFENKALFLKDEEGYQLVWDDSLIFPNLASTDKVRVSTTQAERGEILDRNGRVLAGKGTASSVGIVPGKGELQTYYIGVRWKEGGVPEIQGTSVSNVAEIKLTEKGYFIYAYEYVIAHASLRQYWRIEPLPEDCQELTEKYISGLSYVNYNVLVTNWNSSNVKDILMPCMYEDIYRISTGENLKTEDWKIPAEEYERIMTTYFPVSIEQLREYCGYDEGSNSYEYEMIYASPYPPFGEVVDYTKNADGTITLIVDGVWPDYNSDLAFRNTVVVQPFEDGTFRYLSNSIEQIELELPPIARTKG